MLKKVHTNLLGCFAFLGSIRVLSSYKKVEISASLIPSNGSKFSRKLCNEINLCELELFFNQTIIIQYLLEFLDPLSNNMVDFDIAGFRR